MPFASINFLWVSGCVRIVYVLVSPGTDWKWLMDQLHSLTIGQTRRWLGGLKVYLYIHLMPGRVYLCLLGGNLLKWRHGGCRITHHFIPNNQGQSVPYSNNFPIRLIVYFFFQNYPNPAYLIHITFTFDKCRRSLSAITHVEYERNLDNLTYNFATSET